MLSLHSTLRSSSNLTLPFMIGGGLDWAGGTEGALGGVLCLLFMPRLGLSTTFGRALGGLSKFRVGNMEVRPPGGDGVLFLLFLFEALRMSEESKDRERFVGLSSSSASLMVESSLCM